MVKKHGTTIAVKLIFFVDVYLGKNVFQKFYPETKSAGWQKKPFNTGQEPLIKKQNMHTTSFSLFYKLKVVLYSLEIEKPHKNAKGIISRLQKLKRTFL